MVNVIFGKNQADLQNKIQGRSISDLREQSRLAGTSAEIVDQLAKLSQAGVQRVMLQWLDQDDIDGLEALAQTVLPQVI